MSEITLCCRILIFWHFSDAFFVSNSFGFFLSSAVHYDWNFRISSKNYESLLHSINKWIMIQYSNMRCCFIKVGKTCVWIQVLCIWIRFCWVRRLKYLINFWSIFYSSHSEHWEVENSNIGVKKVMNYELGHI